MPYVRACLRTMLLTLSSPSLLSFPPSPRPFWGKDSVKIKGKAEGGQENDKLTELFGDAVCVKKVVY